MKGDSRMKILLIGGTGTISTAITRKLSESGHEVYLLNRGSRNTGFGENVNFIVSDINNEEAAAKKLDGMTFDTVCEFIGFIKPQLERDFRLFRGKCAQFIYISSASAYNKTPSDHVITEGTSLANPYWQYSHIGFVESNVQ